MQSWISTCHSTLLCFFSSFMRRVICWATRALTNVVLLFLLFIKYFRVFVKAMTTLPVTMISLCYCESVIICVKHILRGFKLVFSLLLGQTPVQEEACLWTCPRQICLIHPVSFCFPLVHNQCQHRHAPPQGSSALPGLATPAREEKIRPWGNPSVAGSCTECEDHGVVASTLSLLTLHLGALPSAPLQAEPQAPLSSPSYECVLQSSGFCSVMRFDSTWNVDI